MSSMSACKKFVNDPNNVVEDALKGLIASNQALQYHPHNPRVILRSDTEQVRASGKVTLVAGGGSGHEPFAAGYIGRGGLTAAVCGDIFASPPSKHVSDAVEVINGTGGTLIFVINYTGDRLHFGMAAERLKAKNFQAKIDLIYIDDDVALEAKSGSTTTGGRGLAGAALTLHIAGVLAEHGADYETVRDTSRRVIENLGTFGVSLYACALPGRPRMFEIGDNELELGLGIHGEAGLERRSVLSTKELVDVVLQKLCASKRLALTKNDKICLLLNNLGSVSNLELSIVQGEALTWLVNHGYKVARVACGAVMTSVDGHGFSLTILKVRDPAWVEYLDAPSPISNVWNISTPVQQVVQMPQPKASKQDTITNTGVQVDQTTATIIKECLLCVCAVLSANESELNRLDNACGDGDCGSSLKAATKAIEAAIANCELDFTHPKVLFLELSHLFEDAIGGTSGAIYALLLGAASNAFQNSFTSEDVKKGLEQGLKAIIYYGHAKPGYRTMVDALHPAVEEKSDDWHKIVELVEAGAKNTAKLEAKSGRASYTSAAQQQNVDPGAWAVALWFRAIHDKIYDKY